MEIDSKNLSLVWMFIDELTADCWERSRLRFDQLGMFTAVRYARILLRTPGTYTHTMALRHRMIEAMEEVEDEADEAYDEPIGSVWNQVSQHYGTDSVRL